MVARGGSRGHCALLPLTESLSAQMLPVGSGAPEGKFRDSAYYVDQTLFLAQGLEQDLVLLKIANLVSYSY